MNNKEKLFIFLLIVNAVIALLYLLIGCFVMVPGYRRKEIIADKKSGAVRTVTDFDNRGVFVMRFIVMLLCPFMGIMYFSMAWLLQKIIFHKKTDLNDVVFGKDRTAIRIKADEERERNIVPMEEGLAVSDNKDMRALMMSVAKDNAWQSLAAIKEALHSDDTETAHYAASVLQDILSEFRCNIQLLQDGIQELQKKSRNNNDPGAAAEINNCRKKLIEYMEPVLEQHVFQNIEQTGFVKLADDTAEALYRDDTQLLSCPNMEQLCKRLIELQEFERAEIWCVRQDALFPDNLEPYRSRLLLTLQSGQHAAFLETVDRLKKSTVVLDAQTLELIRFLQLSDRPTRSKAHNTDFEVVEVLP